MQSLTLSAKSGSSGLASTKRSAFQGFSNAIKRLFNVEAKASQLTQTFQTTATTSASLNNAAALNAEFLPVVFASAKFTPPPPPHFQLVSKLTKLITIAFVSLFLIGCYNGGGGGDSDNDDRNVTVYRVSFYDGLLDRNGSIEVKSNKNAINLSQLKADLGINASALYAASSDKDVSSQTVRVTGDTNFYAAPNVNEIRTQANLAAIDDNDTMLNAKHILLEDIALSGNWTPIGSSAIPFKGVFNGNRHKITNLQINSASDNVGLFGYIKDAQIRNIGVETADGDGVKGKDYVGAIVGNMESGAITNSYAKGKVGATGDNIGGIAGFLGGTLSASYAGAEVRGRNNVGGIAGNVYGADINNSYATGNVSGAGDYIGGIAGYVEGVGGIGSSYARSDVNGSSYIGGLAGYVTSASSIVNNAAINGKVTGDGANVNRLIGTISGGATISNNFARSALTSGFNSFVDGNDNSGSGKTDEAFRERATYENATGSGGLGWKFGNNGDNPWDIAANKNNKHPYLYWE
ncbi:MAG: hypothetical protein LBO72_05315 [Helicobacteraceae bacterium]|jgi:hypothetical protein|nr:hypothetical protein [Helicobacteraceae bacterium]